MVKDKTCSVIVVDNEEVDRYIIDRCLELYGIRCEVMEFNDAYKAIEYFQSLSHASRLPDMVITDMKIDGADGLDIIRTIRENAALAEMPIVAMTSYPGAYVQDKALAVGADLFFIKPPSIQVMDQIAGLMARIKQEK
jgi:CheY-like chemotaxis protein